jgi:hypothetical protein
MKANAGTVNQKSRKILEEKQKKMATIDTA